LIGQSAGSYRIIRQVGQGGMGAVYLGEHLILGRPAAIKILLPELSQNREIVGRFFNEARAVTAIRHPGIVEIYDFGFLPTGAAFIAMEFLEGETLTARLARQRRLDVSAASEIGRQIAAALHAAHMKLITHRDLKPDNVFVVPDPELGERVKLLDFGIAKLSNDVGAALTRSGSVMGTPVYMSPEQCRGSGTVDYRADLYSLGCMLYELVTGRPPFAHEGAGDVIAHHLYFQPEPVRQHLPTVPEAFEQLTMALLSKNPAQRPASAAEVAATLERWRTRGAETAGIATVAPHWAPVSEHYSVSANPNKPTTLSGSVGSSMRSVRAKRSVRGWAMAAAVLVAGMGGTAAIIARYRATTITADVEAPVAASPPVVASPLPAAPAAPDRPAAATSPVVSAPEVVEPTSAAPSIPKPGASTTDDAIKPGQPTTPTPAVRIDPTTTPKVRTPARGPVEERAKPENPQTRAERDPRIEVKPLEGASPTADSGNRLHPGPTGGGGKRTSSEKPTTSRDKLSPSSELEELLRQYQSAVNRNDCATALLFARRIEDRDPVVYRDRIANNVSLTCLASRKPAVGDKSPAAATPVTTPPSSPVAQPLPAPPPSPAAQPLAAAKPAATSQSPTGANANAAAKPSTVAPASLSAQVDDLLKRAHAAAEKGDCELVRGIAYWIKQNDPKTYLRRVKAEEFYRGCAKGP
jgi:serine/threonine protein kinase